MPSLWRGAACGWRRKVFHCLQLTQIFRDPRSLYTIHLRIPSLVPLEMRKVQQRGQRPHLERRAFAQALSVDRKQVRRWRQGTDPCGGAMHSLFRFALRMPGGLEILMGEGFRMTFWEKES